LRLDHETPFQHDAVSFAIIHSRKRQKPKIGVSGGCSRFGDLTAKSFNLDPRLRNLDVSDISRSHTLSVDRIDPLKTGEGLILAGEPLVSGQGLNPCLGRFFD
jgi:hypothetical protein